MINIINTNADHVRTMSKALAVSNKFLWRRYRKSIICKTAFFSDNIAAIWGITGELFGNTGYPWMVLSPVVNGQPMKMVFAYNNGMRQFQSIYPILEDYVATDSSEKAKMLKLIGFNFEDDAPFVRAWRQ